MHRSRTPSARRWIQAAVCVLAVGCPLTVVGAQDEFMSLDDTKDEVDWSFASGRTDDPSFPVCERGKACDELPNIKWADDIDDAMAKAQEAKKPVLIVFSARQQEPGLDDDF